MSIRFTLALIAGACLLLQPWRADAQTAPIPMHAATAASTPSPKTEDTHKPLAWSQLGAAQQRMLAPVHEQWNQLSPARQHRLAQHASHWATQLPAHRKIIRERLARWAQMTPQQRQQLRENARAFHKMTPEQRKQVRAAYARFQSLPAAQRRALRERWRKLSPAQRAHWARHPDRPIPMHPPAHSGH